MQDAGRGGEGGLMKYVLKEGPPCGFFPARGGLEALNRAAESSGGHQSHFRSQSIYERSRNPPLKIQAAAVFPPSINSDGLGDDALSFTFFRIEWKGVKSAEVDKNGDRKRRGKWTMAARAGSRDPETKVSNGVGSFFTRTR